MDKKEMVEGTLTENLIKGGELIVKKLDEKGFKVDAAFWFYFDDLKLWTLMLSFKNIEKIGPKKSYENIQKALSQIKKDDESTNLPNLGDITLVKYNAPILKLLKIAIQTKGSGIAGIRFSNNVINGQFISDAYIYRLR